MPTLAEVRTQYPQYNDISDAQLADALHSKFYGDMPRADFNKAIGFQPTSIASSYVPAFIADVPHEAYAATADALRSVKENFTPRTPQPNAGIGDTLVAQLGDLGRTGKGLVSLASVPLAPFVGAGRSLIGHPMASLAGTMQELFPPAQPKTPEELYTWGKEA